MQENQSPFIRMSKGRLEAFSDGVLAIIITIMVLELKVPHTADFSALVELAPVFLSYIISFIYVGIYWNNHHHLFQVVKHVNGATLWANNHLLFWLSLLPFVTAWSGENHFASMPVALYGFVLLMCAIAYYILIKTLLASHDKNSDIARAIGNDFKGKVSPIFYILGMISAPWLPYLSLCFYIIVAGIWLAPDKRVENVMTEKA